AQVPVLDGLGIARQRLLGPDTIVLFVPTLRLRESGNPGGHRHIRAGVQLLRIEPLPPFPLAVFLPRESVVRDARQTPFRLVTIRGLKPVPRMRRVVRYAEAEAV